MLSDTQLYAYAVFSTALVDETCHKGDVQICQDILDIV